MTQTIEDTRIYIFLFKEKLFEMYKEVKQASFDNFSKAVTNRGYRTVRQSDNMSRLLITP